MSYLSRGHLFVGLCSWSWVKGMLSSTVSYKVITLMSIFSWPFLYFYNSSIFLGFPETRTFWEFHRANRQCYHSIQTWYRCMKPDFLCSLSGFLHFFFCLLYSYWFSFLQGEILVSSCVFMLIVCFDSFTKVELMYGELHIFNAYNEFGQM